MRGPGVQDGLSGADTSTARISGRSEPMILRGAGGTSADSAVGGAVDGAAENFTDEIGITGDDGGGEVVLHTFAQGEDVFDVVVGRDDLERAEELFAGNLTVCQNNMGVEAIWVGEREASGSWGLGATERALAEKKRLANQIRNRASKRHHRRLAPRRAAASCEVS